MQRDQGLAYNRNNKKHFNGSHSKYSFCSKEGDQEEDHAATVPSNDILIKKFKKIYYLQGPPGITSQVYKYRYQVIRPNLENIGGKGVGGHLRGGHPRIHHREGVRGGLNIQKLYILYL